MTTFEVIALFALLLSAVNILATSLMIRAWGRLANGLEDLSETLRVLAPTVEMPAQREPVFTASSSSLAVHREMVDMTRELSTVGSRRRPFWRNTGWGERQW